MNGKGSTDSNRLRSNSRENMIHGAEDTMKKHKRDDDCQEWGEIELNGLKGIEYTEESMPKQLSPKPRCFCLHPWICCCCVWMLGWSWKMKIPILVLSLTVMVIFVVWAVLALDMNTCVYTPIKIAPLSDPSHLLPAGKAAPTAALKQSHGFVLTLLGTSFPPQPPFSIPIHPPKPFLHIAVIGDSYLIDPEWNWKFHDKLHTFLGGYNFTIYNHGRRGERMKDVVVDMRKVFYNHSAATGRERGWETRIPDGIIIMTGSDINSEIPWNFGSPVRIIPLYLGNTL